jgi:hypothetical protein
MKNFSLLFSVISLFIVSCNSSTSIPDLTEGITGTYIGSLNVTNPSLQNTSYTVTVSKVSNSKVRVTPSTGQASTYEMDIMKPTSTLITCVACSPNQLTFQTSGSSVWVSYNYNSNEQFNGSKQ